MNQERALTDEEKRWQSEFRASADLQNEFSTEERYLLFKKYESQGRVRICNGGRVLSPPRGPRPGPDPETQFQAWLEERERTEEEKRFAEDWKKSDRLREVFSSPGACVSYRKRCPGDSIFSEPAGDPAPQPNSTNHVPDSSAPSRFASEGPTEAGRKPAGHLTFADAVREAKGGVVRIPKEACFMAGQGPGDIDRPDESGFFEAKLIRSP